LRIASPPLRFFLETCRPIPALGWPVARTFSKREIEERLDEMFRRGGEGRASAPRDDAAKLLGC